MHGALSKHSPANPITRSAGVGFPVWTGADTTEAIGSTEQPSPAFKVQVAGYFESQMSSKKSQMITESVRPTSSPREGPTFSGTGNRSEGFSWALAFDGTSSTKAQPPNRAQHDLKSWNGAVW